MPNVDFRIWKNGREINQLRKDYPATDENLPEYQTSVDNIRTILQKELNEIGK